MSLKGRLILVLRLDQVIDVGDTEEMRGRDPLLMLDRSFGLNGEKYENSGTYKPTALTFPRLSN